MKISELPEPYKTLAEAHSVNERDELHASFYWSDTPEGHWVWSAVDRAVTEQGLPAIIKSKLTKGEICVILQQVSDSCDGQVNLDSRIMQEKIADKILEGMK